MILSFVVRINDSTFWTFVARLGKCVSHCHRNSGVLKGLVTAIRARVSFLYPIIDASTAVELFARSARGGRPDYVVAHLTNVVREYFLLSTLIVKGNN